MTEIRGGNARATQKWAGQRVGNARERCGATLGQRRATGGDTHLYYYVVYSDAAALGAASVVASAIPHVSHPSTLTAKATTTVIRGSFRGWPGCGERRAPAFHSHRKF